MFIDKQVLFKKKFRNYAVKRASDDVSILNNLCLSMHNLKVLNILSLYATIQLRIKPLLLQGEVDSDAVECNAAAVTEDQVAILFNNLMLSLYTNFLCV